MSISRSSSRFAIVVTALIHWWQKTDFWRRFRWIFVMSCDVRFFWQEFVPWLFGVSLWFFIIFVYSRPFHIPSCFEAPKLLWSRSVPTFSSAWLWFLGDAKWYIHGILTNHQDGSMNHESLWILMNPRFHGGFSICFLWSILLSLRLFDQGLFLTSGQVAATAKVRCRKSLHSYDAQFWEFNNFVFSCFEIVAYNVFFGTN